MRRMPSVRPIVLSLVVAGVLATSACGSTPEHRAATVGSGQEVTVFAAASLRGTFTELGRDFERAHPGTRVRFSFAGSRDLVAQIDQGAPADVLATADQRTMGRAMDMGLMSRKIALFAVNSLTLVTPPDNPKHVTGLADLAGEGVQVVVCAPQVPCGVISQQLMTMNGVPLTPASEEQSVTDVLGKVVAGQADAGLVYRTDAIAAGSSVHVVPVPEARKVVNRYTLGVTARATAPAPAAEFVDLVGGPDGWKVMEKAGFEHP